MLEIKNRIIKSGPVDWKKLKFIQQENFKELNERIREKIKASILNNNFVQSFIVWKKGKILYCLDGYHRVKILKELESEGYKVPKLLNAEFINCKDEKEASKLVLIYSSVYARVTEEGISGLLKSSALNLDELLKEINIPDLDLSTILMQDDMIPNSGGDEKESIERPMASMDEYSTFELVMIHENKLKIIDVLNKVKEKYKLLKLEDALMKIINSYKI